MMQIILSALEPYDTYNKTMSSNETSPTYVCLQCVVPRGLARDRVLPEGFGFCDSLSPSCNSLRRG